MPQLNSFCNLEAFSQRYLKPLLIDPLEQRLNALPDYALVLPPGSVATGQGSINDKSGVYASNTGLRARFVRTPNGWLYGDHVLLQWQHPGDVSHERQSEQDLQYGVSVSEQPDMAGVPRLTVDLYGSLMRYERDAVSQSLGRGRHADLGRGWARVTLHWALQLQLIVDGNGRANLISRARKSAPVADAGKSGGYIASDPLAHLLHLQRLTHAWDHGSASLGAVQDYLVSRLAAAIEPALWVDAND